MSVGHSGHSSGGAPRGVDRPRPWRQRCGLYALMWLVAAMFVGCSEMTVAPVSGVVTLDGEPLPQASVLFEPEAGGRPSFGVTDDAGHYRLAYSMHEEGAEVGKCRVTVSTALEGADYGSRRAPERVPARYAKQPLVVDVLPRSNTIAIDLTSQP